MTECIYLSMSNSSVYYETHKKNSYTSKILSYIAELVKVKEYIQQMIKVKYKSA